MARICIIIIMDGKYSTLSILIKRNDMYYIFCFIVRNICMYKQGSFVLFRSALVSLKIVEIEGGCFFTYNKIIGRHTPNLSLCVLTIYYMIIFC